MFTFLESVLRVVGGNFYYQFLCFTLNKREDHFLAEGIRRVYVVSPDEKALSNDGFFWLGVNEGRGVWIDYCCSTNTLSSDTVCDIKRLVPFSIEEYAEWDQVATCHISELETIPWLLEILSSIKGNRLSTNYHIQRWNMSVNGADDKFLVKEWYLSLIFNTGVCAPSDSEGFKCRLLPGKFKFLLITPDLAIINIGFVHQIFNLVDESF